MEQIQASRQHFTGTNAERIALKKTTLKARDTWLESDSGDEYEFSGNGALGTWEQTGTAGADHTLQDGGAGSGTFHNRERAGITSAARKKVTFSPAESISQVTIHIINTATPTDNIYIKAVFDAPSDAIADDWLTTVDSVTQDAQYHIILPSTIVTTTSGKSPMVDNSRTFSFNIDVASLSRIDFLASGAGTYKVIVEAS